MFRKSKKFLPVLLTGLLLLTACTNTATPTTQETTAVSTSTADSTAAVTSEPAFTWSGHISNAPLLNAPPDEDIVTPYLIERLEEYGIYLDYELVFLERAQYTELLNARLASGDAPDIFYSNSTSTQASYYQQGLIKSWTEEFFRQYAPNVSRIFDEGGPYGATEGLDARTWALCKATDDMMITVPIIYNELNMQNDIMYNGLWLEALGVADSEVPKTLDEFEALMRRFVDEDPDGNSKDDTYGFSSTMFYPIYGAFGVYPGYWMQDGTGGLVYGDVNEGMRDALETLARFYTEGLIDPEFITEENAGGSWAISHALANGKIGVTNISCYIYYIPIETLEEYAPEGTECSENPGIAECKKVQGHDFHVVVGSYFTGPDGYAGSLMRAAAAYPNTLYNANMDEEKLATCLYIMDVFAQDTDMAIAARYGIPGENWTGVTDSAGTYESVTLPTLPDMLKLGGSSMRNLYGPADVINDDYWRLVNGANYKLQIVADVRDALGSNSRAGYIEEVFAPMEKGSLYRSDLDTYRSEVFTKIIRGEEGIEAYDDFVTYWYENGGQEMTDEANAWYASIQ